jgi:hypothetical protein
MRGDEPARLRNVPGPYCLGSRLNRPPRRAGSGRRGPRATRGPSRACLPLTWRAASRTSRRRRRLSRPRPQRRRSRLRSRLARRSRLDGDRSEIRTVIGIREGSRRGSHEARKCCEHEPRTHCSSWPSARPRGRGRDARRGSDNRSARALQGRPRRHPARPRSHGLPRPRRERCTRRPRQLGIDENQLGADGLLR